VNIIWDEEQLDDSARELFLRADSAGSDAARASEMTELFSRTDSAGSDAARASEMTELFSRTDGAGNDAARTSEMTELFSCTDGAGNDAAKASEMAELFSCAADAVLDRVSLDSDLIEVSLSFADEEAMRALNNRYRGIDRVTDVLSFPQYPDVDACREAVRILAAASNACVSIGDVVICPVRAFAQAREYGHSPRREFLYLFVHSLFHLLGYDHENADEKQRMRTAEEAVMVSLAIDA
jgi:probable rRNA maturation factor